MCKKQWPQEIMMIVSLLGLLFGMAACEPLALPTLIPTLPAPQTSSPIGTGTAAVAETPDLTQTMLAFETEKADAALTLAYINTSQPIIDPARPTGIIDMSDPSLAAHGYAIQNSWQQQLNGQWAQAFAGSLMSDPAQGVIIVTWDLPGRPSGGVYNTPTKAGSVRIIAEQNFRLTLQSETGITIYFDVPGQRFVSSLTEVAPTVTRAPTFTPEPPTVSAPTSYPISTAEATAIP